ncbi:ABC-2 transporter permease [Flagellimonas allohymeniacidonis]|uniref:Uncharacterized protein n=1 Tax=Flagellimonas allohymeniacidonis TaxID=2517819 RepID=A0A4Q8QK67_9FLAO|nr:ABC-2 transporter permease [Allomuricauda hymeniacidonis]TAI49163.1 hypothetical protein EW142_05030 [Allomuricauda hymeniacidonis]
MGKEFDISRIVQFIKRDLTLQKNTITIGLLVGSIVLFLLYLFNMVWDKRLSADEFLGSFSLCYFPLGIFYVYTMLREFQNPKFNHSYLSLPVSNLERITAKWLNGALLYTLVFSLIGIIVGILAMMVGIVVFGAEMHVTAFFSENYWKVVKLFLLIQPTFMVGALTFSKNRVGKTLMVLGLLFIGFLLFNFIGFGILNHDFGVFSGESSGSEAFDRASQDFSVLGRWFYGLIFGPLMLVVAYFKMVEKEV